MDVLDRVAGEHTALHRLGDPLLDRRYEPAADRPSLAPVLELEPAPGLGGRDRDVAVAGLAAPPRLLLVAPVGLGGLADRLDVGHLRWLRVDLGVAAPLHPIGD